MEIVFLKIILSVLCFFGVIMVIIFFIRKKDNEKNDVYKLIYQFNEQMKSDIETLELGNKEIDKIEKKILICKKKLNMNLFNSK